MFSLKVFTILFLAVLVLSLGQSFTAFSKNGEAIAAQDWRTARRDATGIAPNPITLRNTAVVQVYAAHTFGWRGLVAIHPWIIFKRAGEANYNRYEVIGWGGNDAVRHDYTVPDGYWFGARPRLLVDYRGATAAALIPQIEAAIKSYPYPHTYHSWPGPNSNTFMAHIGREVPDLKLDLPANAIGKDYRPLTHPVGLPPSGKGLQVSLMGVLGLTIGAQEGIEINILGINMGVDVLTPALRLPFIGRLGYDKVETDSK